MERAENDVVRILVVDDDQQIRRSLQQLLSSQGYEVSLAENGEEALLLAQLKPPQLVILDLAMPEKGGLATCRELRQWSQAPILVLSVHDTDNDKVAALDLGADDYLTKPFSGEELLARVRAHLRRQRSAPLDEPIFESGDLRVDIPKRVVSVGGQEVKLTPIEFEILRCLIQNGGRVVTHALLLRHVWRHENESDTQTLRVHVGNLRRKIERDINRPRHILTEPGVGYRLNLIE